MWRRAYTDTPALFLFDTCRRERLDAACAQSQTTYCLNKQTVIARMSACIIEATVAPICSRVTGSRSGTLLHCKCEQELVCISMLSFFFAAAAHTHCQPTPWLVRQCIAPTATSLSGRGLWTAHCWLRAHLCTTVTAPNASP